MARFINVIFAIRKLATAGEQMLCQTQEQTIQHLRLCQNFFIYYPSLHYCLLCYKLIFDDEQVYLNVEIYMFSLDFWKTHPMKIVYFGTFYMIFHGIIL